MRTLTCAVAGLVLAVACGGSTTTGIGGSAGHGGAGGHAGSAGGGGTGGGAGSRGSAGSAGAAGTSGAGGMSGSGGAAGSGGASGMGGSMGSEGMSGSGGSAGTPIDGGSSCKPPDTGCAHPCPSGTYCLITNGPGPSRELGCTTIPPACMGKPTCDCMASCFCSGTMETCMKGPDSLICETGAISRREFKKDISYLTADERSHLARAALSIPLAQYRYRSESELEKKHLGFIIDDQPQSSPAVAGDQTHVDEYGYASMLLAAVQEQQKQIDALKSELAAAKKCGGHGEVRP